MKTAICLLRLLTGLSLSQALSLPSETLANCKDVYFELFGTAQNRVVQPPPPNIFQDFNLLLKWVQQPVVLNTVSGVQKIYGQYCEPTIKLPSRDKTLQLLVHGLTYSHLYWNGFEETPIQGDTTSWAAFASQQGYSTLAIDRLGFGKSGHPDPLQRVQLPYQAELYHDLIQQLRSQSQRRTTTIPDNWDKIIWVGHSFGSSIGTYVSAKYPEDADAFVQTGVAVSRPNQSSPLFAEYIATYIPAAKFDPDRFPPKEYSPGYVVSSKKEPRQNLFYTRPVIDFDPAKFDKDFATQEPTALGESLLTQAYNLSTTYDKPVFVTDGQNDSVFCSSNNSVVADCGSGPDSQIAAMKSFYPAVPASKFEIFSQPNAGHCLQIHRSAPLGFAKAQAFLTEQGF